MQAGKVSTLHTTGAGSSLTSRRDWRQEASMRCTPPLAGRRGERGGTGGGAPRPPPRPPAGRSRSTAGRIQDCSAPSPAPLSSHCTASPELFPAGPLIASRTTSVTLARRQHAQQSPNIKTTIIYLNGCFTFFSGRLARPVLARRPAAAHLTLHRLGLLAWRVFQCCNKRR